MAAIAPVKVPRLVLDALYAPQTPHPNISALLDVALTHHNCGRIEKALKCYADAREAWETALLRVAAVDGHFEEEFDAVIQDPSVLNLQDQVEPEDDGAESNPSTMALALARSERRERLGKVAKLLTQRERSIPAEHRIFLHLAVASVYSTAIDDANALAELTLARRLLVSSVPVYHASLLASSVYAALGAVHFHLSQYDFAGDYFFRCLESREVLCGADHVDTAAAMNNVGAALFVLGKVSDSLVLFNRAVAVVTSQLPASHPRVDVMTYNAKLAKDLMLQDAAFAPIPFTPYTPGMIPGAKRALLAKQPKPKKAKPAPKKGK